MAQNPIPVSAKLPPKSLNKDIQDDELPETNIETSVHHLSPWATAGKLVTA
ncbi:hypothetical protein [Rhizobium sp. Root1203]|uniref:hypothetical protein n=1 Tax=Rhizobium sp. Root1203 TaxID=1736427 RepID=UPI000A70E760|nr:hypothetical protein [Rhizobium sp. Root1203]